MKREEFKVIELGTIYELPKYRVIDSKGIEKVEDIPAKESPWDDHLEIIFVRGDKEDNGKTIPRVDGILHEQLLGMMIEDLTYKNSLVPSRESSVAITKLQEALHWLVERSYQRGKRNVEGTYKK